MEAQIEIPEAIARGMEKHKLIDWEEFLLKELAFQVSEREMVEEILQKSRLTERDAEEISEKIKESLFQKHYGA